MAGNMTGRGATLVLFVDAAKVDALDVESWDLKLDAEIIKDDVNGEDRSRLDKEINFYSLKVKCFNQTAAKLKIVLRYDASLDADSQPDVAFGLKLKDKRGGQELFSLTEGSIDDWSWAQSGRTARGMLEIPMRFRYMTELS